MSSELLNQVGMDQVADKARENGPAKAKISVKQFLARYRALGLPGAKKFRKKTRLQELTLQRDWYAEIANTAIRNQAKAHVLIAKLIDESNFAVNEDALPTPTIIWVADDTVLEEARLYLKQFTSGAAQSSIHSPLPDPSQC